MGPTKPLASLTSAELKKLSLRLESSLDWLERSLAREKLIPFMERIIQWPEEINYMPRLAHIQEWASLVENHDKLLVEASRDHFKSTFFSFVLPLFWVQKVTNPRDAFGIAMFAYSDTQSQKYIKRIRQEIETNPWLKHLLPKSKSSVWDATTLDMSNGCWIESYGFGSSFRGRHPKKVLVDDPCKDSGAGAMSIDQQEQFFFGTIMPAVKKKGEGQVIVTGNPVDKLDFLERLETNKAFVFKRYPVINERGEPLAPQHYNRDAIEDKRMTIPPHIFAREYMLKRVSSADARFKEEWIVYYKPEEIRDVSLYKVMTIDPALSPSGDALACVVTGTSNKEDVYVLDCLLFHGDLDVGVSRIVDLMERHRPDFIGFENFALQNMYKSLLEKEIARRGLYFRVDEVGRDSKKKKAVRIESLQPILSQRRLRFLIEHKELVNQLLLWDPISKTNEDDGIDALAWQVPLWRRPGDDGQVTEIEVAGEGTFNEAFERIRMEKIDGDWMRKMWQDMGAHNA
jgi:hypothetical protein